MKKHIFLIFLLLIQNAFAGVPWQKLSAKRGRNENYQIIANRLLLSHHNEEADSAYERRIPYTSLDLRSIPTLAGFEEMTKLFELVRENKFFKDDLHQLERRLTWLYPDDGCWARAELASDLLLQHNKVSKKIFAFGNLVVKSSNASAGEVYWWYHVANSFSLGGIAYIFDPAIDPYAPMTLAEWNKAMGGEVGEIEYSLCHPLTFDPEFSCDVATENGVEMARNDETEYLLAEWLRVLELGRNPQDELGAKPPWLN
jgi:hypothetical protein